jgi:hypothetical protein
MNFPRRPVALLLAGSLAGCVSVKTAPIEVKPIQITVDVNVNVKVEKALNDFFGDLDRKVASSDAGAAKP